MPRSFELVPNRRVGAGEPCFIIAEIGQNHQGDVRIAKELILHAKNCGADCVKFQKSSLPHKFTKDALQRPYKSINAFGETYGEHKAFLEFSNEEFTELKRYSSEIGIPFTASAMDNVSADLLESMWVPFIKIGSGDTNNLVLLQHVAQKKIPLVVSSGMQDMETMRLIYKLLKKHDIPFAFLQCTSSYPTPLEEINLKVIESYKTEFPDIVVGYSGHEEGYLTSVAAVAIGAKIIERHLTLDKTLKGTDHRCSLEPNEFTVMVEQIRKIEMALGSSVKTMQRSELQCFNKLGKSIVAARSLTKGNIIHASDVAVKVATSKGCCPVDISKLIGRVLLCDVQEDQCITLQNVA